MSEHLAIRHRRLESSAEWLPDGGGWWFARIHSGSGFWMGPEQRQSVSPGMVLVIPGGASGGLIASRLDPLEMDLFCFRPETIVGVFSLAERMRLSQVNLPVSFIETGTPLAIDYAALVARQHSNDGSVGSVDLLHLGVRILVSQQPIPQVPTGNDVGNRLKANIRNISDSKLVEWPTSELARSCNCTPRHFRRVFKELFGKSLNERQTEVRLQKAMQLLMEPNMGIGQIAKSCGYRHPSLLEKQFQQRFQTSIEEYRCKNTKLGSQNIRIDKQVTVPRRLETGTVV